MADRLSSRTIVGRAEPLRLLGVLLDAVARSQPQLLLVTGEAGVGKTRLLGELERRAGERGMLLLHGECVDFGGAELPYAPFVGALRDVPAGRSLDDDRRGALAGLFPRLGGTTRAGDAFGQARLFELLLELLGELAARAPILLALEDVHWADRSSRDLLAFLARNLTRERVAVALTCRTGELPAEHPLRRLLAELSRRPNVTRVDLAPLDRAGVALQLEAIAGAPVDDALAGELHARSGGNPFFVEELFAARSDGGLPATLAEAVLARIGRLPDDAREVLAALGAAGGRTDAGVLEAAVGIDLGPPLRAALDAGLVVRDGEALALRHGLIGEVLYERLAPGERAALHAALAEALAGAGAPPARLAVQWHRAGRRQDALAASVEAGVAALADHAFAEASGHLERAIALWQPDDAVDRVELLAEAARAARFAGDREHPLELLRAALAEVDAAADPERAALLHARLGEYQYWDDEAALECYGRALELLLPGPSAQRAHLLTAEGHALMGLRRWGEARERCEAALSVARELGDEGEEAAARMTLGLVLAFLGEHDVGEAHLRRALELPAGELLPRAYVHLGELLRLAGRHADAFAAMEAGERAAAQLGMRGTFGYFMHVNAADDLLRLGRWDEAAERLRGAERLALALTAAVLHGGLAGQLHALRGEPDAARAHLERALALLAEGLPAEFGTPVRAALATLALAEGDPAAASAHVEAGRADARDPLYGPALLALGVRAAAEEAERARARRADGASAGARARGLLTELEALGSRSPEARAHQFTARAELGAADAGAWRAAAAAWDALREPHPAAYARLREAEALLAASGDRVGAAPLLAEAHATAAALGARPLREATEALARRARLGLRAAHAEPGPRADLELTSREAEVLALLAEGLTNREIADRLFITAKTVGTHVAHIFEKLGVHNRVEAAGRAQRLGIHT